MQTESKLTIDMIEAQRFHDTQYMTAKEKERVIKAWERFLEHGCQKHYFTEALYHHLMQHCQFIAHYSRAGFFNTYFVEPEDTIHFLSQFDRSKGCQSIEYGGTYWLNGWSADSNWAYKDINNALVDVAAKYIPMAVEALTKQQRAVDLARARLLLAKHNISMPE